MYPFQEVLTRKIVKLNSADGIGRGKEAGNIWVGKAVAEGGESAEDLRGLGYTSLPK